MDETQQIIIRWVTPTAPDVPTADQACRLDQGNIFSSIAPTVSEGQKTKVAIPERINNFVMTAKVVLDIPPSSDECKREIEEELFIPPRRIVNSKGYTLLGALLLCLETAMGVDLIVLVDSYLNKCYDFFQLIIMADAARANELCIKVLHVLLFMVLAPSHCILLIFYQRCGAHQLFRICSMLLTKFALLQRLYACSKLFQSHRPRSAFQAKVHETVDRTENFYRPGEPLHKTGGQSDKVREDIKKQLRQRWDATPLWEVHDGQDALDRLFAFYNLDLFDKDQFGHACPGCCKDEKDCKARGKQLIDEATFNCSRPGFEPARFSKQLTFMCWVFVFHVLHGLGGVAVSSVVVNMAVWGAGCTNAMLELIGVRWKKTKELFLEPLGAFYLYLLIILLGRVDAGMRCFMHLENTQREAPEDQDPAQSSGRCKRRRRKRKPPAEGPQNWKPDILSTMKTMRHLAVTLFAMLLMPFDRGPFWLLTFMWPRTREKSEMYFLIRVAVLNMLAQLYLRFLFRYTLPPYSLTGIWDDQSDEYVDSLLAQLLLIWQCCLDTGWSKPVVEHLKKLPSQFLRRKFLIAVVLKFMKGMRSHSIKEEWLHSRVKHLQKGDAAITHLRIQILYMLKALREAFMRLGGRDPARVSDHVTNSYLEACSSRDVHPRPTHTGGPLPRLWKKVRASTGFKFLSKTDQKARLQQCSRSWRALPKAEKDAMRVEQVADVVSIKAKRKAEKLDQLSNELPSQAQGSASPSPWGLGSKLWPIRPSLIVQFVYLPFATAAVAIQTLLMTFGFTQGDPELEDMHGFAYHVGARMAFEALWGEEVSAEVCRDMSILGKVKEKILQAASKLFTKQTCSECHMGLCSGEHSSISQSVKDFTKFVGTATRDEMGRKDKSETEKFTSLFHFSSNAPRRSLVYQQIGGRFVVGGGYGMWLLSLSPIQVYVPCRVVGEAPVANQTYIYPKATFSYPHKVTLEQERFFFGLLPVMCTTYGLAVKLISIAPAEKWRLRSINYTCESLLVCRATGLAKDYKTMAAVSAAAAAAKAAPRPPDNIFMRDGFTSLLPTIPEEVNLQPTHGGVIDPLSEEEKGGSSSGSDGGYTNRFELAQEFLELRAMGVDPTTAKHRKNELVRGRTCSTLAKVDHEGNIISDAKGKPIAVIREDLLRTVLAEDQYHSDSLVA